MKFFVNTRSGVPIYKQLIQQIEKGVAGDLLRPGEQLPTVRELALELTVNPNTVARAYRELEFMGIIDSKQGRGTYIAETITPAMPEEREMIIKQMLEELVKEAGQLGLTPSKLKTLFDEEFEKWKQGGV